MEKKGTQVHRFKVAVLVMTSSYPRARVIVMFACVELNNLTD